MNREELHKTFEANSPSLFRAIDQAMGTKISTSRGFQRLSTEILRRTGGKVSTSTLKRLYGYVHDEVDPRESTLNSLCAFIGFASWQKFCESMENASGNDFDSGFVNTCCLDVTELPINAVVRLTWAPDRVCSCLYRGNFAFKVLCSENTRLVSNTTFQCSRIHSDQPLVLDNVLMPGSKIPASYSIGRTYGIHFEIVIP